MTLADLTSPGLVIPSLQGKDVASVLQELSQALLRERRIPDALAFCHAVLNRELLVSTEMETGMAFPHARAPGIAGLSFALGRSREPLKWGATTAPSVRLVFLIAVPETDSAQHLQLISGLARLSKDSRLVEKLLAAEDALQVLRVLQQISLRPSPSPMNESTH
jgi:mannitol/fructose-specific phosphotransferase system IIA component (Ntr-type)